MTGKGVEPTVSEEVGTFPVSTPQRSPMWEEGTELDNAKTCGSPQREEDA